MNIDWEAEWDNLAQTTQKTVRELRKSWDRYLPSFSTIPRLFADTQASLRFNMEVLSKRYKRTSADAPTRVEPGDTKIPRLKPSSRTGKQGLRQSSACSCYKTLQMVYQLDSKRQLGKPRDDMVNAVSKHCLK